MIHLPTKHSNTTTFDQYLKNRQACWFLVFCLLGLTSSAQAEPRENWNYESRFTAEGFKASGKSGTYAYDPHVWVYTTAFAKRFGMPEKWIDDSLKGAEALAYRVDWTYYKPRCGYFGELKKCRAASACMLDLYIPSSANLPWNTEQRYDSRYGKNYRFLSSQDRTDRPSVYRRTTQRGTGVFASRFGLDDVGIVHGKDKGSSVGSYYIAEYERGLYRNLDYISGAMSCSFQRAKDAEVRIYQPKFRKNGSVDVNNTQVAHKVVIPNSFMDRVESYAQKEYEPHSLTKDLENNLKQKGK